MKIALVTSSESKIDIFEPLHKILTEKIYGSKIEAFYVPTNLDIPKKIKELDDFDTVFVMVYYEKEDFKLELMMKKLLEVEEQTGISIIKGVEESPVEDVLKGTELKKKQKELAEHWGRYILDILFNPDKFVPGYSTDEEEEGEEEFEEEPEEEEFGDLEGEAT